MKALRNTLLLLMAVAMLSACGPKSRRNEIEQRKEALKQKQDSALTASQQELAWVDSALQAAIVRYDQLQEQLHAGKHTSTQMKQLGDEITAARLHRDSLQIRYDVLCGKIRYIHHKQETTE